MQSRLFFFDKLTVGSFAVLSILLCFFVKADLVLGAEAAYEQPPVLTAGKILPPNILSGPNHRVQDRVLNDGFLNIYTIDSKFGQFRAVSTSLLRKRVQEIDAMARMDKLKATKEYGTAVKESALSAMVAAKDMVFQPVQTVKTAASGVAVAFRRAGDSIFGAKRSDAEDSRFKSLIGFSNYKREYAYDLGVDVYSRNQVLQDRLDEISWVGFAGGLTVSAAMAVVPGGAGTAMTAIGATRLTTEIFKNQPPVELRRINTEKLKAMGIDDSNIETFIGDSVFTPREQTILVAALDELKGVGDRERLVQLAALTNNADMALFRQRQAEMYAGYHKAVAPLTQFVSIGPMPAARSGDGTLVFLFPIDYLVWTDSLARLAANTDLLANQLQGIKRKELWLTGNLSPRARKEMRNMGWVTFENAEALLVAQDKGSPSYRKEGEKPDATVKLQSRSVAFGAGVSSGDGVISYQGKDYPFTISGLSLLDIGVSNVSATGRVYFLKNISDFSGNYFATQATFALAGGGGELVMANGNGVYVALQSQQSGTQLTLGPSGVSLKLK
jgi:hypothetical protein